VATKVLASPQGTASFYRIAEIHFRSLPDLEACAASDGWETGARPCRDDFFWWAADFLSSRGRNLYVRSRGRCFGLTSTRSDTPRCIPFNATLKESHSSTIDSACDRWCKAQPAGAVPALVLTAVFSQLRHDTVDDWVGDTVR
jgi:hypothetical protein